MDDQFHGLAAIRLELGRSQMVRRVTPNHNGEIPTLQDAITALTTMWKRLEQQEHERTTQANTGSGNQ